MGVERAECGEEWRVSTEPVEVVPLGLLLELEVTCVLLHVRVAEPGTNRVRLLLEARFLGGEAEGEGGESGEHVGDGGGAESERLTD